MRLKSARQSALYGGGKLRTRLLVWHKKTLNDMHYLGEGIPPPPSADCEARRRNASFVRVVLPPRERDERARVEYLGGNFVRNKKAAPQFTKRK